jgi:hypothetical protein
MEGRLPKEEQSAKQPFSEGPHPRKTHPQADASSLTPSSSFSDCPVAQDRPLLPLSAHPVATHPPLVVPSPCNSI